MISNDIELKVTRERISYFQSLLAQLRTTATREEFPLVSGGYRAEIETMQQDVLQYLSQHISDVAIPAKAVK